MQIRISADSTCDLSPEQIERYRIRIAPLYVNRGGEMLRDGVDVFPDDLYAHVAAGGELCSTAAVNCADYQELFRELTADGSAVIHVCLSSEMSSCFQNARLAAQEFENVYVVDSRSLSAGHGLVVLRAAILAESGMEPGAIAQELEAVTEKVSASFVLERLDYMRKGGRCSAVAALGANLLKLRPGIRVTDGKMGVDKKYRGSMEKCIREYVHEQLADPSQIDRSLLFITHSGAPESVVQAAMEAVRECAEFDEIVQTHAGCTICSHCGPGTLGVLFVRK